MVDLAARANSLLDRLSFSVTALEDSLVRPSVDRLRVLETRVDALRHEWTSVLDDIAPFDNVEMRRVLNAPKEECNAFIRSVVAFASLIQVVSRKVGDGAGLVWGRHLFGDRDFEIATFEPLDIMLSDKAVRLLVPGICADVLGAVDELLTLAPARPYGHKDSVYRAIDGICAAVGASVKPAGLDFALLSASRVAAILRVDEIEIRRMAESRQVVSVPLWGGERMYPDFQFDFVTDQIWPTITELLAGTPESFKDWSLAIWLHKNHGRGVFLCKRLLSDRGLWTSDWSVPPTGAYAGVVNPPSHGVPQNVALHRVTKRGNTPFFFSTARTPAPGAATAPAGRFDLPDTSPQGSLYLAEDPVGAWAETLDREPVITLGSIAHRDRWELAPAQEHVVADLTSGATSIGTDPSRADTQALASSVAPRFSGLRAVVRSRASSIAVVLFGAKGATLPEPAGVGLWGSRKIPGLRDDSLWDYLEERAAFNASLPTVLRRFPDDLRLS